MKKSLSLMKCVLFISSFIITLFTVNEIYAVNLTDPQTLEKAKKAIVTIESRIAVSAYENNGNWRGTGFINDKEYGFIVTNAHVVGQASIGTYIVTFYNGQQAEAKLVYYDSWQDYAILKVEKAEIPISTEQIIFSKTLPKLNQNVLVVGNTEGQGFSFHTGYLSSLYDINGMMPQCSYIINLNSAGGASGSPILNDKNEAIGVLYGGGKTYAIALHANYPLRALDSLKMGKIPTRNHIGIISELYSLDKAVKHRNFPKKEMEEYLKKFPDTQNKVVAVKAVISGSTAEKFIKPGDIIWEVDNMALGGSLAVLDIAMDKAVDNKIKLVIYRDGRKIEQIIPLYNVNDNKVKCMVDFAGAIFFTADDYISAKSGIELKALTVANVQAGSSFSTIPVYFSGGQKNIYRMHIHALDNDLVFSLNDLIKNIPNITKKKFITIKFKNYQPYYSSFGSTLILSHDDMMADIMLDNIDAKPRILKYDSSIQGWVAENIKN